MKLLPLLRRQLEVGRIEIDGLDLRLRQLQPGLGHFAPEPGGIHFRLLRCCNVRSFAPDELASGSQDGRDRGIADPEHG